MWQFTTVKCFNIFVYVSEETGSLIVQAMRPTSCARLIKWIIWPACNYERRPLFKYSGCHKYDMSAFNVILGKMFSDVTVYTTTERVFGVPTIVWLSLVRSVLIFLISTITYLIESGSFCINIFNLNHHGIWLSLVRSV
jgi:hypothetical protein